MEYPLLQVVKRTESQHKNPNMDNFVLYKKFLLFQRLNLVKLQRHKGKFL